MNNFPRETLRRILNKYGNGIAGNSKRCESLLNDLCGSYRREINVLVNAVEERVPLDLLAGAGSIPLELLLTRFEKRLEEQTALTGEAARWAVESWAFALNLASESDIERRQKRVESAPVPKTEKIVPRESAGSSGNVLNPNNANQVQTPTRPPRVQPSPLPPRAAPPVIRQPQSPPVSPPVLPANNQTTAPQPHVQPQTSGQPQSVRRSFGFFRGCLIVVLLLAVASVALFFGVPYAIEVMRETQRERNSEPPRFPVR